MGNVDNEHVNSVDTAGEVDGDDKPVIPQSTFTVVSPDDLHTEEYERFINRQMTYAAIYTDDLVLYDPPGRPEPSLLAAPTPAADAIIHEKPKTFDLDNEYGEFFNESPEVKAFYQSDALQVTPTTPISSPDGHEHNHLTILSIDKEEMGEGQGQGDTNSGSSMEEEPTLDMTDPHHTDLRQCGPGTGDA